MKKHAFAQDDVLMLFGHAKKQQDSAWSNFERLCSSLDLKARVTGGLFLTHEINCCEDDFNALIELLAGK